MMMGTTQYLLCILSLLVCELLAAHTVASASSSCRSDDVPVYNRGGSIAANGSVIDNKTRDVITRFLDSFSADDESYPFHIQGWRWHSMSLMRDSRRLERLAKYLSNSNEREDDSIDGEDFSALEEAASYVINFNMSGLFRIESKMFVDFLREHLCKEDVIGSFAGSGGGHAAAETDAFRKLVGKVDEYRVQSENIGKVLYERAKAASNPSKSYQHKQKLLADVAQSSRQLLEQLASMRNLQETLIVPAIARVVPSKVQKSFNNKVLLNLGLLESRTHLVGMHDAVWESGIEAEKRKFETEIPYVARMMIERWRQSLYIPKAGALDYGLAR